MQQHLSFRQGNSLAHFICLVRSIQKVQFVASMWGYVAILSSGRAVTLQRAIQLIWLADLDKKIAHVELNELVDSSLCLVSFHSLHSECGLSQMPICYPSGSKWSGCHLHDLLTLPSCQSSFLFFERIGGQIFPSWWETAVADLFVRGELCLLVLLGFMPLDSNSTQFKCIVCWPAWLSRKLWQVSDSHQQKGAWGWTQGSYTGQFTYT